GRVARALSRCDARAGVTERPRRSVLCRRDGHVRRSSDSRSAPGAARRTPSDGAEHCRYRGDRAGGNEIAMAKKKATSKKPATSNQKRATSNEKRATSSKSKYV